MSAKDLQRQKRAHALIQRNGTDAVISILPSNLEFDPDTGGLTNSSGVNGVACKIVAPETNTVWDAATQKRVAGPAILAAYGLTFVPLPKMDVVIGGVFGQTSRKILAVRTTYSGSTPIVYELDLEGR